MTSKLIKVLALLFVVMVPVVWFNKEKIFSNMGAQNPIGIIAILALLCFGGPFVYLVGQWLEAKLRRRFAKNITGDSLKKVLPQKVRDQAARECLERYVMTDSYLQSISLPTAKVMQIIHTPSRDDVTQWDLYIFSAEPSEPDINPAILPKGDDMTGITIHRQFYVFVNCCTGEAFHRRFENIKMAEQELMEKWERGIRPKSTDMAEADVMKAYHQTVGTNLANKSSSSGSDDKKRKGEKDEEKK